jgi:phosphatidyl-myo-inositol alpha-mannosyltransferase
MNVLMTIPGYWPHVRRGSERVVHDLAMCLGDRGHAVTVVTRAPSGPGEETHDGATRVLYRRTRRLPRVDSLELFAVDAALAGLTRRADIHHAFYLTDAYGLFLAGQLRRAPLVLSLHGPPDREWWSRVHPRTARWLERVLRSAAAVTVLSEDSATRLRRDYGREAVVVAPGVFADDFALPRREQRHRTVVCAAAVDDPRKRVDLLIDAFQRVASREPDLELLLVGPGDPQQALGRAERAAPEIRSRIRHVHVPTEQLPQTLSRCTVGALTSETEAFGLVLVESMAAGMPVIGTDDGGIPEVIAPGTGFLFTKGDVSACADALAQALRLADAPATEARCREHARTYDWSRRIDAYLSVYESVQR